MAESQLLAAGVVVADTYEIERLLGKGGMGEVWLASHRRVAGKQVALKVLKRAGELHPDMLARFKREAEIAARLEHPSIVQVLDFAFLPTGEPYLVMEYLRGESLAARLKLGPLPLHEVQALVVQVGSALHVAHGAGVVHRDLKPENIFLVPTPTGDQVKVLDFGISKLVDSRTVQTSDSVLIGTPLYMSPEQATGDNQNINAKSDIFSLGSVVFEALSGKAPFVADNLARVVYRVAFEQAPSLKSVLPSAPDNVVKALQRALTKNPADRTPDIATFVRELTGVSLQTGQKALTTAEAAREAFEPTLASKQVRSVSRRATGEAPQPQDSKSRLGLIIAGVVFAGIVGALGVKLFSGMDASTAPPKAAGPEDAAVAVAPVADAAVAVAVAVVEPVAPVDAGTRAAVDAGRVDPRPRQLEKLTAEQKDVLKNAEAAIAAGRWNDAIEWTNKPAVADTTRGAALRLLAYCHLGNFGMVTANKTKVTAADRAAARKACAERGIDL